MRCGAVRRGDLYTGDVVDGKHQSSVRVESADIRREGLANLEVYIIIPPSVCIAFCIVF